MRDLKSRVEKPSETHRAYASTVLLGAAGEYYVMSELLRRNYIAALTRVGAPSADIVVTDLKGDQAFVAQVKTRSEKTDKRSDGGWHMRSKHEALVSERLFYFFVDLGKDAAAERKLLIVPSAVVANVLHWSHTRWLQTPGKNARPRNDGDMRRFLPDYSRILRDPNTEYKMGWLTQYAEAWHLLPFVQSGEKQLT